MEKEKLLRRLQPFASGCFSGDVSEWPQLKPLLKDVYDYISSSERPLNKAVELRQAKCESKCSGCCWKTTDECNDQCGNYPPAG